MNDMLEQERKAIEATYSGKMKIVRKEELDDPLSPATKQIEKEVYVNIPCALSKDKLNNANQKVDVADVNYTIKLFCAPEIEIKAGDRINVEQDGMNYHLKHTGEPFKYPTHQEIIVERDEKA